MAADRLNPAQRGYGRRWRVFARRFADEWIAAGQPCALCGQAMRPTSWVDVDHITPLIEEPERMFDPMNLRVAHHHCHARRTAQDRAAAERGYRLGVGSDGLPTDDAHPFNRGEVNKCK